MLVETFEVSKEIDADGKTAPDCESIKLMESLGLTAQLKRVHNHDKAGAEVCPYRRMTDDEARVYGVLCPERTRIDQYDDEAIPLRVLQVAAHAKVFFPEMHVWHPKTAAVKDPVLVGRPSTYSSDMFILARWGTELASFAELKAAAAVKFRADAVATLKRIIAEATADLRSVEADCVELTPGLPKYETFGTRVW